MTTEPRRWRAGLVFVLLGLVGWGGVAWLASRNGWNVPLVLALPPSGLMAWGALLMDTERATSLLDRLPWSRKDRSGGGV